MRREKPGNDGVCLLSAVDATILNERRPCCRPVPPLLLASGVLMRANYLGILVLLALTATFGSCGTASAQFGFGAQQRSVGGVVIDPSGEVRAATGDEQVELSRIMQEVVGQAVGELTEATDRRVISLKKLQNKLTELAASGQDWSPELAFLGGLRRVEYVVVDTDHNDVLLVGPAGPWKMLADGSVVSSIDGISVNRLDDLLTAFQSVESARVDGGIRCSIEPTAEGRERLQKYLSRVKLRPGQNPAVLEAEMREAFGPQQVLLAGLPTDSLLARTLVAADFEMKRIAMSLTDSPVAGLPSYLELIKNTKQGASTNPRWWMACNYEPISREASGKVWKISGQGVKTLTETDLIAEDGTAKSDGRQDPLALKWAELMTEHYSELAQQKPIFADLRNAMDLTVVATLIRQENLDAAAGIDLAVLRGQHGSIPRASFPTPATLQPQCSFVHGRAGWTVTASGGVNINAFEVAANQVDDSNLQTFAIASTGDDRWWWNAKAD